MFRRLLGRMAKDVVLKDLSVSDDYPFRPFDKGRGTVMRSIDIASTPPAEMIEDGHEGDYTWIDLRDVPDGLDRLHNSGEIIAPKGTHQLVIDYPLAAIALVDLVCNGPLDRRGLCVAIHSAYQAIYATEEAAMTTKIPAPEDRGLWLNRPPSDGPFEINGHDMNDLAISTVDVYQVGERTVFYPDMYS